MPITIPNQEEIEAIRLELDALYRHLDVYPYKVATNTARGFAIKFSPLNSSPKSPEAICGRLMAEMEQHVTKGDMKDLEERLSRKLSGRHEKDLEDKKPHRPWKIERHDRDNSWTTTAPDGCTYCDLHSGVSYPGGQLRISQRIRDTAAAQYQAERRVQLMVDNMNKESL